MFKLKQFTGLLLIVMLAFLTSSTALAASKKHSPDCENWTSESSTLCGWCDQCLSAEPPDCLNFPFSDELCADAILNRLGNVNKDETLLDFSIANIQMRYESVNPECNAPPAQGTVFAADQHTIAYEITSQDVEKNGRAIITGLCFPYDFFLDLVRPNVQWNNCWFDIEYFDVSFVLTQDGTDTHVIWAHCVPVPGGDCDDYNGVEWSCTKTCDSQTGEPAYCE